MRLKGLELVNQQIDQFVKSEGGVALAPLSASAPVAQQTKDRMDMVSSLINSITIENCRDEHGNRHAQSLLRIAVKIRTISENERKAAKRNIDNIYLSIFSDVADAEKSLRQKLDDVKQEREEEAARILREQEERAMARINTLREKFGMVWDPVSQTLSLGSASISKVMLSMLGVEEIKGWIRLNVLPEYERLKAERLKAEEMERLRKEKEEASRPKYDIAMRRKMLLQAGAVEKDGAIVAADIKVTDELLATWDENTFSLIVDNILQVMRERKDREFLANAPKDGPGMPIPPSMRKKFESDPHFPMTEISGLVKRLRVVAQKAVWDDASTARKFISMIDTMEEIVSAQRKSTDDQLEL